MTLYVETLVTNRIDLGIIITGVYLWNC